MSLTLTLFILSTISKLVLSSFGKFQISIYFHIFHLKFILFIYSFKDVNFVHLEQLSNNFAKMFDDRNNDHILSTAVNQQVYFAHKNILSSTSSYLRYFYA